MPAQPNQEMGVMKIGMQPQPNQEMGVMKIN